MEQQKMKRAREGDDETQKGCFENNKNAKKRDVCGTKDVKKEEGCSSEALGVFDFPWLKDGVTTKPEDYLLDFEDNFSSLLEQEDSSFKAATACIDFSSEAKLEDLAWQPFESDVLELEADDGITFGALCSNSLSDHTQQQQYSNLPKKVISWKRTASSRSSSSRNALATKTKEDIDDSESDFVEELCMIVGNLLRNRQVYRSFK